MKKLILLIALITLVASVNAQVSSKIESKQVQVKYDPQNHQSIVRLEIDRSRDTVRVFYYRYVITDGVKNKGKRLLDCYVPWQASHTYAETYQLFNAWIREKYDIE